MKKTIAIAIAAAALAAPCMAGGRAAAEPPAAEALVLLARTGAWTARFAPDGAPGLVLIPEAALAACVAAWRAEGEPRIEVRTPDGRRAGDAFCLTAGGGALYAGVRLDRAGARAWAQGCREAEPVFEAVRGVAAGPGGARAPAMVPAAVRGIVIRPRARWRR